MKKLIIAFSVFTTLILSASTKAQRIVRVCAPPPPPVPCHWQAPGPHHVWVNGDWVWSRRQQRYIWKEGYWAVQQTRPVCIVDHRRHHRNHCH